MRLLGFTLLELLIVLAIVSMTALFIVPSYRATTLQAYDDIVSSQLLRAIRLAQSEAMMRYEKVTLKPISDNWGKGFVITSAKKQFYAFPTIKKAGTLHWRAFPLHHPYIQFTSTGVTQIENGTFWYCADRDVKPRWAIVVNKSGRARIVYPDKWGDIEAKALLLC